MNYPTKEGKNGLVYQIAEGVRIIPRKDGYWILDAYQKGERIRRAFEKGEDGLKKAVRTAELYAAKLGIELTTVEQKYVTISDVAEEWVKSNRARWTGTTVERYSQVVRDFVNPVIGGMPIDRVTRIHVRDLLAGALLIRSAKSVELIYAVTSGIFSEAIERGYTNVNPCNGLLKKVLPPKHKRNESAPDPLSRTDLDLVLDAAKKHLPEQLYLVIETLAYSGMRLGECLAMKWSNLDVPNNQYMIAESVRRGKFGTPKAGSRLIDLPEALSSDLERYIKGLRKEALKEGGEVGYLFPKTTERTVRTAVRRACQLARIRVRTPHDLRHTYATLLLMSHMSPAYVQKQLGHHSITMTVDTYGHWIPGEGKGDLSRTLSGRKEKPLILVKGNVV
jgi:integrase